MARRDRIFLCVVATIVLCALMVGLIGRCSGQEPTLEERVQRLEAKMQQIHEASGPQLVPTPIPDPDPDPEPDPTPIAAAEGFGAATLGGNVPNTNDVHVTRLDDPKFTSAQYHAGEHLTEGTLRWAMHQPGPKKIIFDQPGFYDLWCSIQVKERTVGLTFNATRQPIAIAGCIRLDKIAGSETVWLNTRFRAAKWNNGSRPFTTSSGKRSGPQSSGDCLALSGNPGNTLIDHCECSGGADELFNLLQCTGKVTIQWSCFYEGFKAGDFGRNWGDSGGHNYGGLISFKSGADTGLTVHHCYFANLAKRMPTEISSGANPPPVYIEMHNNLFYNWREFAGGFESRKPGWISNNTWFFGPSAGRKARNGQIGVTTPQYGKINIVNRYGTEFELVPFRKGSAYGAKYVGDVPPEPLHEYPVTIEDREAGIESVLTKAGVLPMDNISAANRQAYRDEIGWQGAHPDYRDGTLKDYLIWATEVK